MICLHKELRQRKENSGLNDIFLLILFHFFHNRENNLTRDLNAVQFLVKKPRNFYAIK